MAELGRHDLHTHKDPYGWNYVYMPLDKMERHENFTATNMKISKDGSPFQDIWKQISNNEDINNQDLDLKVKRKTSKIY